MKTMICTPSFGAMTHTGFAVSLAETYRALPDVTWMTLTNCADITLARNTLLAQFMATDYDVLLWIDADEAWSPSDVLAVLAPIEEKKAHVVSALVSRKRLRPVNYAVEFLPEDVSEEGYVGPVHGAAACRYGRLFKAGCGFLACSRHALEKASAIVQSYQPWASMAVTNAPDERHAWLFGSQIAEGRYQSEDYSGSNAFRAAGFDIWFSMDARVSHFGGPFRFGGEKPDVNGFAARMASAMRQP